MNAMSARPSWGGIGVVDCGDGGIGGSPCMPAFGYNDCRRNKAAIFNFGSRFGNFRGSGGLQCVGEMKQVCGRRQAERLSSSVTLRSSRIGDSASPCLPGQLKFLRQLDFGNSFGRRGPPKIWCSSSSSNNMGMPPLEESRPDEAHESPPSLGDGESEGRRRQLLSLVWLLGPFILVASVVLPPLYLRKIFGAVLEDSLVTDFVILFFTETLFFVGASVFLYIAHISRLATAATALAEQKPASPIYPLGYRTSAKIALAVGLLLPAASFVIVFAWTGPAAAAALAPYMIGLLVQLGFEQIIRAYDSPVWPLVPITFQMYRLHQLNRAAQLVAGLLFSLKGVEATAETMAINGSLQTLLFVLQVLGMLCLWSLGSFLTNHLPSELGQQSISSLP